MFRKPNRGLNTRFAALGLLPGPWWHCQAIMNVLREVGQGFAQSLQQILSTFSGCERSTASAISETVLGDQRSTSSVNNAVTFKPLSAGQSERHVALRDGLHVDGFNSSGIPRSWEQPNVSTINGISKLTTDLIRRGQMIRDENISTKNSHPQGPDDKKSAEIRPVDISNAMVPAQITESLVMPANLSTPTSWPEQLTPPTSGAAFGPRNAQTNRCDALPVGSPSLVPGEQLKTDEQIDVEGAETSPGPSLGAAPKLMMHGAHDEVSASVDARPISVQKQDGRLNLDLQNAGELSHSSRSERGSGIPIDKTSTAEPSESGAFETLRLTHAVQTIIPQRGAIGVRDNVSNFRANAHLLACAPTSISQTGTIPASIATHEESSALSYPYVNRPQIGLVTSDELTDRSGRASEVFGAIEDREATSQWTLTGSHRAEAGFQDASLGWVSVRAQAGSGGIHAVVIPASDAAGQVLNMHLAGLNAHMTPQYEHLNPVTLGSSDAGMNSRNAAEHSAHHHGSGGHQSETQQGQENYQSPPTDTVQNVSSPMVGLAIGSVGPSAITAGKNPGEQHVSVIV